MKKKISIALSILFISLSIGCSTSESEIELNENNENVFEKNFKNKEVLIYTRAFRASGERTVGEMGMPVKFKFDYNKNTPNILYFEMPEFQFGNMPLAATIKGELDIINKYVDAYPEKKDWIYFGTRNKKATAGSYIYNEQGERIQHDSSPSAEVNGYYNPKTNEIFMDINFKLMSVTSICPDQKFDAHSPSKYLELLDNYYDLHRQINKVRNSMFNFSNQLFKATVKDKQGNSKEIDLPLSFSYNPSNPEITKAKIHPTSFTLAGQEYLIEFKSDVDFLFNPDPPIFPTWKTPIHTKLLKSKKNEIAYVTLNGNKTDSAQLNGTWQSTDWFGESYNYAKLRLVKMKIVFDQGLEIDINVGAK
ncbi:DUF4903 family protein [Myroides odoratimimus]|uniref:DUF4903 family protein n=1 Tax=Myroides odoratimimus TaxID=76832 RepID=UPI001CE1F97E|nr:DUF4903 family protein [Myroides odoratimimus]MCA4807019.1 DUF4903 family protein [Myroides odoratimimus]